MRILTKTLAIFALGLMLAQQVVAAEEMAKGVVLVTGGNRGVGLALVEKYHAEGYTVIATARKPEKAAELKALGVRIEQLDVTNSKSVENLKAALKDVKIDVLINNAGISGHSTQSFADLDVDKLAKVFDVNSMGALRVSQALLPNLEGGKKIVASISSMMGSIAMNDRGCCYGYRASKAALNSFNKSLSLEYAKQDFIFVVLHPGWVRTDMGTSMATYSTKESVDGMYAVLNGLTVKDNGKFYDLHGKKMPW